MSLHTLWSPSSLHRRLHCPGSANAESGLPEVISEEAADGTGRHWIRETALEQEKDVEDFLGEVLEFDGFKLVVDQEWVRTIQPGIDYVRELGGRMYVEVDVSLDRWMPGERGTLDTAVVVGKTVHIIDGKFGRDPVYAEECEQLMGYALSFWVDYLGADTSYDEFVLTIDQPYMWGGRDSWTVNLQTLLDFGDKLTEAYERSKDPKAPRIPGAKACRYCKASDHCRESAQVLIDLFNIDPEGKAVIPEAERLSNAELGNILRNGKLIKKNLEKYESRAKSEIMGGHPVPFHKMVDGAGTREWTDEDEVEAFLLERFPKDKVYIRKLISVAQAENLLGTRLWAKVQKFIRKKDAAPQLVDESDKRPSIASAIELFADEGDDELDDLIGAPDSAEADDMDDLI